LKIPNRTLLKIFQSNSAEKKQSRFACKKLSSFSAATIQDLRQSIPICCRFSIKGHLIYFNQSLLKIIQSGFDGKMKIKA